MGKRMWLRVASIDEEKHISSTIIQWTTLGLRGDIQVGYHAGAIPYNYYLEEYKGKEDYERLLVELEHGMEMVKLPQQRKGKANASKQR